ncbi:type IIL restriction-modification enzyme MmeI [Corynebacterium glucuronolyticum]
MAAATRNSKVKSAVEQRLERADAARSFVATWSGRGYEKGDTASFWIQLLSQVVGLEDVVTAVHFEERVSTGGFIDAHIPSAKTLIEQKALVVNLGKPEMRQGRLVTPFEQAKAYADEMKNSNRPDYISVSNFSHFRIHDLDQERPAENYVEFSLEELPEQFHLLDFIVTG